MEGKQGTIIEMGTKGAPVNIQSVGIEGGGELSVRIQGDQTTQTFPSPRENQETENPHPEEGRVKNYPNRTTIPLEIGTNSSEQTQTPSEKQKADSEKTPEELLTEKREQAQELFDQLGDHLDPQTKEKLMDEHLNKLLHNDKQQEDGNNIEDTFSEIRRLIMILISLFLLLVLNPNKTEFTGKDLGLEDKAPDFREGNDVLTRMMTGKGIQESWDGFKKEVEEIGADKPVPFGELMSRVLAANEKNNVKTFKSKNTESKNTGSTKNQSRGFFGRIVGLVRRNR